MATAIYLYCVVHAADVPRIARGSRGIPGAARLTVRAAGRALWIAIAEVPLDVYGQPALEAALQDMNWVGSVAMAHEQVVEQFSRQRGCTVIPMKLFTMFSTEKRAVEATRSRAREITALAKRIAGCEEWGVRITRLPKTLERRSAAVEPAATGAAFLAARKQVRDSAKDAHAHGRGERHRCVRISRIACPRGPDTQRYSGWGVDTSIARSGIPRARITSIDVQIRCEAPRRQRRRRGNGTDAHRPMAGVQLRPA